MRLQKVVRHQPKIEMMQIKWDRPKWKMLQIKWDGGSSTLDCVKKLNVTSIMEQGKYVINK